MKRILAITALCAGLMAISSSQAQAQYYSWRHHTFGGGSSNPIITLGPLSTTVASGGTQQFIAHVFGIANTATWSTTDPTGNVTSSGLYTAGTAPGTYEVIVTDGILSATATVTVTGSGPAVATTISVSPISATVSGGTSQQFTAAIANGSGPTSWSTTDPSGSVSSSGLYTAGTTAGTYTVTASNDGVSAAASATVTVASGKGGSSSGSGSSASSGSGSGGSGSIVFQDTFASGSDANWSQADVAHGAQFGVSCSGADYPTCAQINMYQGDSGNNILISCTANNSAGCASNGVNLSALGTYYTYYKMQIPQADADFGAVSQNFKFTYNKNGGGGNVCYYDGAVESEGPLTIDLRAICDSPSVNNNYVSVSLGTSWHTLEEEYSAGSLFNMWWDGIEIGPFPGSASGAIPGAVMTDFEPGLYLNNTAGASFSILLNDVEFCTGGRCPGAQ